MLRLVNELQGSGIHAKDGDIGTVDQFLFDDETWAIRYLVVDTGYWLPGKKVLISPMSLDTQRKSEGLNTSLTREQVKNSPEIDTNKPVSRQRETELMNYYGYPYYWHGPGLWGTSAYPVVSAVPPTMGYPDRITGSAGSATAAKAQPLQQEGDAHLRSTAEVIGYNIEATDGGIGHVEEFIIDDEDWAIRYIVVDTVNWWPGKKVVLAPQWITQVSWAESKVYVDLAKDRLKNAPEYDPSAMISREYEKSLYDYYGRRNYWGAAVTHSEVRDS